MKNLSSLFPLLLAAVLSPGASAQTPGNCAGLANCVYEPAQRYAFNRATVRVTYTDVLGLSRTVEATARIPSGRTGALPVVIWAHGGGEGRNTPNGSVGALSVWSEITAEAGYLTISPAFHAREDDDREVLCEYLQYPEGEACDSFSTVGWDRPFDIRAIIDELERLNEAAGPLRGRIDLNRIAVGGHSAGSTGALTVGGAARQFRENRYDHTVMSDPRPKAIIALSCAGPASHSLFDKSFNDETTSWDTVDRPTLMVTGLGDAHEQAPHARRIPYGYLPPGDKYRLWIKDLSFGHGAYGDDLEACNEGVTRRKCEAFRTVLISTVLSFLDAYIEQRPQAQEYMRNASILQLAGQDLAEWSSK